MHFTSHHILDYFLRLNHLLQQDPRPSAVMAEAALRTAEFLDLALVELYTLDGDGLRREVTFPQAAGELPSPVADAKSLAERAVREGARQVVAPIRRDSPLRLDISRSHSLSAIAALPLWDDGEALGAMVAGWSKPRYRPTEADLENLELISLQLGNALRLARRLSETEGQRDALRQAHESTLRALARAVEYRDYETRAHSDRVTKLSLRMADQLGLPEASFDAIRVGALLHDVGKIAIPDHVLLKPGPLDEEEWDVMRTHPERGWELIKDMPWVAPISLNIVRHHHEHWDGSGYPDGLAGRGIPVEARIFSFVDAYDALRSDRPCRTTKHLRSRRRQRASISARTA